MSEQGETSTPEGPASLRDALFESFDEAEATDDTSTEVIATDEAELETSEQLEATDESSDSEEQDDEEVIQAPEHWSENDRAMFDSLNSDAKEYLLKRENEYANGINEKTEKLKQYDEALAPFRPMLQLRGMDDATAVRFWAQAQAQLDADPQAGLEMLARTYGVELPSSTGETDPDSTGDPELDKLHKEIRQLKNQNQNLYGQMQTTAQAEAYQQVQEFREAKDADGNLLHPHFEKLQNAMQGLITSGAATDLQTAYEQAVWSVPEYREGFIKQQQTEAEKAAQKKREQAAAKAKKVAKGVQGKNSQPAPKETGDKDLRGTLAEVWDAMAQGG